METELNEQEKRERLRAAEDCFRRGRTLFSQNKHLDAFAVWSSGCRELAPAFLESRSIQTGLRKLRRDSAKLKLASNALEEHARSILDSSLNNEALFRYFAFVLFEEGLVSDCFDTPDALKAARTRWQQEYEQMGEPPYARYRLAILDAFEGRLEEALDALRFCQDRFPPKKHESLRLKPLLEAVTRANEAVRAAREGRLVLATPSAWEQAGFSTPFEARPWKRAGIPPDLSKDFKEQGFRAKTAGGWARAGFTGDVAKLWADAGMENPENAKRWHRAGIDPSAARPWEEAFAGDIEKAVLFLKAGFEDPVEAKQWSRFFQFPGDAMSWKEQGFPPEEAGFWYHDAGVKDPYSAKRERALLAKTDE